MTVLRELIAVLGMKVDNDSFRRAIKGVADVQSALRSTGQEADRTAAAAAKAQKKTAEVHSASGGMIRTLMEAAATYGVNHFVKSMVEMASAAGEIQNVLQSVFGDAGLQHVNAWAVKTGDAMGRSSYELKDFVSQLGAVLGPMASTKDRAREMSERMTELAVDLASFFEGSTDAEALHALRSGLTGEAEALKRFGVTLNDATMTETAHTMGIKKKITAMTMAEKLELRYQTILRLSKASHGDAAKNLNTYAGASKMLRGQLLDLGTTMGQALLPIVVRVMAAIGGLVTDFKEAARESYLLESAMGVLATIAGVLALRMAAAFIVPAIVIAGIVAAVDELVALFKGGNSIIGTWLDDNFGTGTAEEFVDTVKRAVNELIDVFDNLPDVTGTWELMKGAVDDVGYAIDDLIDKTARFLQIFNPAAWIRALEPSHDKSSSLWKGVGGDFYRAIGIDPEQEEAEGQSRTRGLTGEQDEYGRALGTTMEGVRERIANNRRQRYDMIRAQSEERRRAKAAAKAARQTSYDPTEDRSTGMSLDPDVAEFVQHGRARVGRRLGDGNVRKADASDAPANMSVNVGPTNVVNHFHTGDPQAIASTVERVLESRDNRVISSLPDQSWSE